MRTTITLDGQVTIGSTGDINIFCKDYVPSKRGKYGAFHLVYENIQNKKDFSQWINVFVPKDINEV